MNKKPGLKPRHRRAYLKRTTLSCALLLSAMQLPAFAADECRLMGMSDGASQANGSEFAFACGYYNYANGRTSQAFGFFNRASGELSSAFGNYNVASGVGSNAFASMTSTA